MPKLYFIENDYGPTLGTAWVEVERDLTREIIINDICHGQHSDVITVLEIEQEEDGTFTKPPVNITKEIAIGVRNHLHDRRNGCPDFLRTWFDHWHGAGAADRLDAQHGRD